MVAAEEANGNAGAVVAVSAPRAALSDSGPEGLETQTRKIGLIYPPPDIRAIADKTALYVAKNGPDFERRVRANEAENTRFNFLKPGDPYHAYYQHKLAENIAVLSGEAPAPDKDASAGTAAAPAAAPPPVGPPPAARAEAPPVLAPTQPLTAPADAQYTVAVPEGLTALDLDVIRLAAAAVARNGKRFMSDLAAREHSNPQFNFLKPTHSLFAFFTALCDAYSRVLMPPRGLLEELKADAASRTRVLERALRRLEWERAREREATDADAAAEAERVAMLQIDWHDFVVVESIDFFEDEADELPPPITLREVLRAARAAADGDGDGGTQPQGAETSGQGGGAPGAAPSGQQQPQAMDAEEAALVEAGAAAGATTTRPPASTATVVVPGGEAEDVDMEESSEDEADAAPVRVVRDYVRPAARAPRTDPTGYVTSPFTGELIAVGDMAEHARVSLLDPRWAQQRHTMLSRLRETTRASDEEISRNLASLASTLPDVFGKSEEELGDALGKGLQAERDASAAGGVSAASTQGVGYAPQAAGLGPLLQPDGAAAAVAAAAASGAAGLAPPLPAGFAPPSSQQFPAGMAAPGTVQPRPVVPPPLAAPPMVPAPTSAQPPLPAQPSFPEPGNTEPSANGPGDEVKEPKVYPKGMAAPAAPGTAEAALYTVIPRSTASQAPVAPTPQPVGAPSVVPPSLVPPVLPPPSLVPPGTAPSSLLQPGTAPSSLLQPASGVGERPPPVDEPAAKRPKLETLVPEEDWLDRYPGQAEVMVTCSVAAGGESLEGQTLSEGVSNLGMTVLALKEGLATRLGLPANRLRLSAEGLGFLRDELSLAHYNVAPGDTLALSMKERGGRRK